MKKILIITDSDLDGAGSALALKWFLPAAFDIKLITTTVSKFRNELLEWLKEDKLSNYDIVFVCDMDTTESIDLIDLKNVYIIDHHETHNPDIYTNCKKCIKKANSTTGLIYELFLQNKNISKEQKMLIDLVDDYDSFTLKYKESRQLNIIYWGLPINRILNFIDTFKNGFKGFDKFQTNFIELYFNKLKKTIKELKLFTGEVSYNNKIYKTLATFADNSINDLAEYLYKKYTDYELIFIVNMKSEVVSLRKNRNCDVDLGKLAKQIGNGGGHPTAAGCKMTDTFMELMKGFLPYGQQ